MEQLPEHKKLKIATIYSYGVNEDPDGFFMGEENSDTAEELDKSSRDFLESAIKDYNEMFKTNYDTSSDKFQNYYKDVSLRMKNREIDLLIVVNMFLTGFDATTLNTLWVDKNLKYHGLIQAFSRTNRILNSVKSYGNIVCFRDLQRQTDDAISLFGDKDATGLVLLKTYDDYYYGYVDEKEKYHPGYSELIDKLREEYPTNELIESEQAQKYFISLFGHILRLINILSAFDQFPGNEILTERELQDYKSIYIDLYQIYKKKVDGEKESIIEDVVFEIDLIKSVEINIDYILMLIEKYHSTNCQDKEIVASIRKAIDSTIELRSKKLLIEAFIQSVNVDSNVSEDWITFVEHQSINDLKQIIEEENLKEVETFKFMENAFRDGAIKTIGTDIDKILPPMSLFGGRAKKKAIVLEKLNKYFEKYEGLM
jgi:type I restriction enzyme R subunit